MFIKPLYLLADSQLLFRRRDGNDLPDRIRADLTSVDPKGAYIGASNADNAEFYSLFVAAMELMGIRCCRMVPSQPTGDDRDFLQEADLCLLAGGDVKYGWHVFQQNGLRDLISRKLYEGATLVGVSAGAVQLGLGALTQAERPKTLNLFCFAPFFISAHSEADEWFDLRVLVNLTQPGARGIGIPRGGGAIYSPDGTLEPIRYPLTELLKANDELRESLLVPKEMHRQSVGGGEQQNG